MGCYRLDTLAQLARQLRFAPIARRLQQLDAAEDLLLQIRPDQTYGIDQITCAITGYEPKHPDPAMLAGVALQHDLGLLLEEVSDSLQLHVNSSPQPVLTIDEVAQQFNVTTKTVQRWRRRGLPARRMTFADGKRRIGFRLGSVQRFVRSGSIEQSEPAPAHSRKQRELGWLVERAKQLAVRGYWPALIAARLSGATGLAPLTIEQLLRQYAGEARIVSEPDIATRNRLVQMVGEGLSLRRIAEALGLPAFGVYHMRLRSLILKALRKPIRFIDDELYHQDDAGEVIEALAAQLPVAGVQKEPVPRDLPPYLRDLYRIPMLTPQLERALFLKYHYCRFLARQAQMQLDPQRSTASDLRRFRGLVCEARAVRARIVEANLRLVVSVARRHVRPQLPLMELVSEGNLVLIRAVDSFDVHRGHHFSTYAVYALMRGYARSVPQMLNAGRQAADPSSLTQLLDPMAGGDAAQVEHREQVDQLIERLEPRQREVLEGRFGLRGAESTCQQLGQRMALTRQRVMQIEREAIARLRSAVGQAK